MSHSFSMISLTETGGSSGQNSAFRWRCPTKAKLEELNRYGSIVPQQINYKSDPSSRQPRVVPYVHTFPIPNPPDKPILN
ncbi:hypothetical protein J1N35_036183 [Gossypium stocksii]|uniref:Uncharacterized protein n=1 Tax=Gossypium stocksii TaxID=47602 RepID=A0A9D3UIC1_9ROSI|nr:hypothetical protein J1N35_036183 [Gossypium stocksii]